MAGTWTGQGTERDKGTRGTRSLLSDCHAHGTSSRRGLRGRITQGTGPRDSLLPAVFVFLFGDEFLRLGRQMCVGGSERIAGLVGLGKEE
ncbi:hypothetical protein BaRGS_00038174 [Batillaria attramentaria]|uniref:Uncharacterized protein n=1 Tax=Batillaria attramentaria TaxID=370345 RepID=A0ABD0J7N0_9CAEN